MLTFTQIPPDYSPLGERADYTVVSDSPATIDIRVTDAADNSLIGAKRFAGVDEATFDAAPCLRSGIRFSPTSSGTGFKNASERVRRVKISAEPTGNAAARITAPARTFIAAASAAAPALLTTMPRSRLIAAGESDELTLLSADGLTVTVTSVVDGEASSRSYTSRQSGLQLFRLDTADFPGAETLTVDAGACGTVAYTLTAPPQGGWRMAWRTHAGSMEYYTFPIERTATLGVEKTRAYGPDGHTALTTVEELRTVLGSAFETREVLEALAGMIASPEVWLVGGSTPTRADVVTDTAVVNRRGVLGCLEIEIRAKRKNAQSWS